MTRPMNPQGKPPRNWGFLTDKNELKFGLTERSFRIQKLNKKKK